METKTPSPQFGRYLTHAYLNMIHAGYQAWFAQENARIHLGYEAQENTIGVDALGQTIDTIVPLLQLLWSGEHIWDDYGDELQSDSARFVREASAELANNLMVTAEEVYSSLHYSAFSHDAVAQQILVTAHARYANGREHYLQGLVAYGEAFRMGEVSDSWKEQLVQCQQDLSWTGHLINLVQSGKMNAQSVEQLFDRTLNLPGIFRAQVQDYRILIAHHAGEVSFEALGLAADQAAQWRQLGFAPEQAGYWHAYGITPHEASVWIPAGFSTPGQVVQWRDRGHSPESARELIARRIAGGLAASSAYPK